jgi:hypothetical protein
MIQWRSTWGKSFPHAREARTRDYPSSCWHDAGPPGWCSGDSNVCTATCCLGLPRPATWRSLWSRCMASSTVPVKICRWLATGCRPAMTVLPTPQNIRKETVSSCSGRNGTRGKSPKLQMSWEEPQKVITRINPVFYGIHWYPRAKMTVVYLDRPAPYLWATREEQSWGGCSVAKGGWQWG